jgi:hypothetical protein
MIAVDSHWRFRYFDEVQTMSSGEIPREIELSIKHGKSMGGAGFVILLVFTFCVWVGSAVLTSERGQFKSDNAVGATANAAEKLTYTPVSIRAGDLLIVATLLLVVGQIANVVQVIFYGFQGVLARMDSATQRELANNGNPTAPPLPTAPPVARAPAPRPGRSRSE